MDVTLPAAKRPKSRQSIAHLPSKDVTDDLKENVTDVVSSSHASRSTGPQVDKKKTRGKSLGPGGLEALKETTGNAIQVSASRVARNSLIIDKIYRPLSLHHDPF